MRRACVALGLGLVLAGQAFGAPEVEVVDPAKRWTEAQLTQIREATETVLSRLPGTEAAKCAYRNAWRGLPSKDDWGKEMGRLRRQAKIQVTVVGEAMEAGVMGSAMLGSARLEGPRGEWTRLEITLNKDRLNYWQPTSSYDLELWTNAIAHEMGHVFGLSHGRGGADWEADYAGWFVTELGFCVATDGKDGSDRGDRELRRTRKTRFGVK